jgi:hypothetical protein
MRTTVVTAAGPFALAALVAAGCGPRSQLDPGASVTLSGTVQQQDGSPAGSAHVRLIKHPDPLQAIGELFVVVGSLGLACITGQADICSDFEHTDTAGDGSYRFGLAGRDTQGSGGQALTFTNFVQCPNSNCAVASDFFIQRTNLTLPALRFWTDVGTIADANGDSQLSWPALESGVGGSAADDYKVSIIAGDGAIWWQQDAQHATSTVVDRRVTQDRDGSWTVIATRKQSGSNVGTDFTFSWYATQQPYPNHNFTPLSRAADCFTQGPDGMPLRLARPCPLTDGNPATKFVPTSAPPCPSGQMCTPPPVNNWIMVDVGFSHPLAFLVLYDVAVNNNSAKLIVETSDDLMTWTPQQTVDAKPYQTLSLAGAGRFLRLRLSDPNAQFTAAGNGEIAVYAPF